MDNEKNETDKTEKKLKYQNIFIPGFPAAFQISDHSYECKKSIYFENLCLRLSFTKYTNYAVWVSEFVCVCVCVRKIERERQTVHFLVPLILYLLPAIQISVLIFVCRSLQLVFRPKSFCQQSPELNPLESLSKTISPKINDRNDIAFQLLHVLWFRDWIKSLGTRTVFLFFFIVLSLLVPLLFDFDPFMRRKLCGGSRFMFIAFIGGGIPIGGGGGGTDPIPPRGKRSSLSSSERRSVKSKSHNVNGRVIFLISSSQCSSFSDFFGSGFRISWSLLGDLKWTVDRF